MTIGIKFYLSINVLWYSSLALPWPASSSSMCNPLRIFIIISNKIYMIDGF
jgi:hypothetical protein